MPKEPIQLYLYESTTNVELADLVNEYFTSKQCEGCMSGWFTINFVSPKDDRETDYTDVYFIYDTTRSERLVECGKIIDLYRDWLFKIGALPPKDAFTKSHTPTDRPLKDSGERRGFATGSRRDVAAGKGRYDLLPFEVIDALAKHYEKGQAKYDADKVWDDIDNWKKGQPLSVFSDSALRHAFKGIAGQSDEDHIIAAIWNLAAYWYTQYKIRQGELSIELGDIGELWLERRALTKKKE